MKKEVVSKEVYISDDGVTFDSEKDCKKHEEALQRIQYFRARTNPDLTESGCTTASVLFAVKCCLGFQKAYCIHVYKGELDTIDYCTLYKVMHFKTPEIRDKFLKEQKELLEIAKPLL